MSIFATVVRPRTKLGGVPPDLPFVIDARSLALGGNFTLTTDFGDLDLIAYVDPVGTYEDLLPRAETHVVGDLPLRFISLNDLINAKEYLGRLKDKESLMQLLAIKRLRATAEGKEQPPPSSETG